jgi:hypothetical protein
MDSRSAQTSHSAATVDTPGTSPSSSTGSDRQQGLAFTKAALVFKGELDDIRHKKPSGAIVQVEEAPPSPPTTPTKPTADQLRLARETRRIRILRSVHHGLSSILSIIIATLQSLTYVKYEQTKDVPGAWPKQPTLFPTLVLLVVALVALTFDICSLIAYLMPG